MKQHITPEQLDELSLDQKSKLNSWMQEHNYSSYSVVTLMLTIKTNTIGYVITPLSIGQMIEFLMETNIYIQDSYIDDSYKNTVSQSDYGVLGIGWDGELCDTLWETVKEALDKLAKKE